MLIQIAGRMVRSAAVLTAVYLAGNQSLSITMVWNYLLTGLPGILIQWCLVPLIVFRIESVKKHYD